MTLEEIDRMIARSGAVSHMKYNGSGKVSSRWREAALELRRRLAKHGALVEALLSEPCPSLPLSVCEALEEASE